MTGRVLLGQRGSAYGLWVSKPGSNVVSAGIDNLLLSMDRKALQIVANGAISDPGDATNSDITIPDLGFSPLVLIWCNKYRVRYSFPGSTTLRLRTDLRTFWPSSDGSIRYAVTNLPLLI